MYYDTPEVVDNKLFLRGSMIKSESNPGIIQSISRQQYEVSARQHHPYTTAATQCINYCWLSQDR